MIEEMLVHLAEGLLLASVGTAEQKRDEQLIFLSALSSPTSILDPTWMDGGWGRRGGSEDGPY